MVQAYRRDSVFTSGGMVGAARAHVGPVDENAPVPEVTDFVCENCGMPDDELVSVRRVYVVPPSWDTPGSETIVPEPELWCISCISQYPCEIVDA